MLKYSGTIGASCQFCNTQIVPKKNYIILGTFLKLEKGKHFLVSFECNKF
jgi:hypothetical protein